MIDYNFFFVFIQNKYYNRGKNYIILQYLLLIIFNFIILTCLYADESKYLLPNTCT